MDCPRTHTDATPLTTHIRAFVAAFSAANFVVWHVFSSWPPSPMHNPDSYARNEYDHTRDPKTALNQQSLKKL